MLSCAKKGKFPTGKLHGNHAWPSSLTSIFTYWINDVFMKNLINLFTYTPQYSHTVEAFP